MEDKNQKAPMTYFKGMRKETWPHMSEEQKHAESQYDLQSQLWETVRWYTQEAYQPSQKTFHDLLAAVLEEFSEQWPD